MIREIIGQILGYVAVVFFFISYQIKDKKGLLIVQTIATGIICLNYLLLFGYTGLILNVICVIRNIAYYFKDKKFLSSRIIPYIFAFIMIILGVLTWEGYYSLFIIIGLAVNTVCLSICNTNQLRVSVIFTCSFIITYNAFVGTIGGIISESMSILSSIIGLIRFHVKNTKITYNFHTHTHRCHHASGTEEEYVLKAISSGIKEMGFSEHFPYDFPDGHDYLFRLPVVELPLYVNEINRLKVKYKDKIKIYLGFEMEYYPAFFEDMLKKAKQYGAEYLILGQHYLFNEANGVASKVLTKEKAYLDNYTDSLLQAIKSGVFTYVAHPDVIDFEGDDEYYQMQAEKICLASKEYNVPLEINCLGIRENRLYPRELFWEIAGKVGCPVTIGFDAHETKHAGDLESFKEAMKLIKKHKLNYIGKPNLKLINGDLK